MDYKIVVKHRDDLNWGFEAEHPTVVFSDTSSVRPIPLRPSFRSRLAAGSAYCSRPDSSGRSRTPGPEFWWRRFLARRTVVIVVSERVHEAFRSVIVQPDPVQQTLHRSLNRRMAAPVVRERGDPARGALDLLKVNVCQSFILGSRSPDAHLR